MGKKRCFATGSKPGPDAIDHYLESQNFYRKHAARDSSSLFRAVSEQVFDIQNYHEEFRQRCACYMEIHSKDYMKDVEKNFHNYVSNLRKHRTSGTLLEVRVMSRMYKRNVFLFEPNSNNTQCSQREYVHDDSYFEEPIRLFYSQKDRHFDAIYPMAVVEMMANTQSIVHEILYKDVLKLPDVMFATEVMLYDPKGETTVPLAEDETKYKTVNDEICSFDTAEDTNCVLKDPATCHFHNQKNFEELVMKNQDSITIINRSDDPGRLKVYKPVDGYLYSKEKSCVRQLLDENITPFPFKVAKALDQSIYRNIEFENWQDSRKEIRQKWLDIDEKFIIYENDPRYIPVPYYDQGYVVDDYSCDKKYMEAENTKGTINTLAGFDIFEPQHLQPSREHVDHLVMPIQTNFNPNFRQNNGVYRPFPNRGGYGRGGGGNQRGGFNPNNNSRIYTNSHHNNNNSNFNPHREQYQNNENGYHHNQPHHQQHQVQQQHQQQQNYNQAPQNGYVQPQYGFNDTISPPPVYQPVVQYDAPPQNYQQNAYPSQGYNNQNQYANCVPAQPDFSIPPPQLPIIVAGHQSEPIVNLQSEPVINEVVTGDCLNLIREGELGLQNINFDHAESIELNGGDLPTDAATLQFFFNLGLRYFKSTGLQKRSESVSITIESTQQGDQQQDAANNNVEILQPVAQTSTNAPVVMQSNQNNNCQNGNREQYTNNGINNNNNMRRNQNQNRGDYSNDYSQKGNQNGAYNQKNGTYKNGNFNHIKNGHHQNGKGRNGFNNNQVHRKEIQFNPNVKNVHKVDSNPQKIILQSDRSPVANGKQEPPHEKSPDSVNTDSTGYGSEVIPQAAKQVMPQVVQQIIPPQTAFVQQVMLEPQIIQQIMPQEIPRSAQHNFGGPPPQMEQSPQQRPFYRAQPFVPQQQQQNHYQRHQVPIQQPQVQQPNQNQPQHYLFFFHSGNGHYVQQFPIYYQQSPPQNYVNNSTEPQNGNEIIRYNENTFQSPQTYTPIIYQQPPQRAQYYYADQQVAQITSYNETAAQNTHVEEQQNVIEDQQNGIGDEEENDDEEIVSPRDGQQNGNEPADANE